MKIETLRLVSRVFKGITVATFNERFGACTDEEIRAYVLQQYRLKKRYSITERGCEEL